MYQEPIPGLDKSQSANAHLDALIAARVLTLARFRSDFPDTADSPEAWLYAQLHGCSEYSKTVVNKLLPFSLFPAGCTFLRQLVSMLIDAVNVQLPQGRKKLLGLFDEAQVWNTTGFGLYDSSLGEALTRTFLGRAMSRCSSLPLTSFWSGTALSMNSIVDTVSSANILGENALSRYFFDFPFVETAEGTRSFLSSFLRDDIVEALKNSPAMFYLTGRGRFLAVFLMSLHQKKIASAEDTEALLKEHVRRELQPGTGESKTYYDFWNRVTSAKEALSTFWSASFSRLLTCTMFARHRIGKNSHEPGGALHRKRSRVSTSFSYGRRCNWYLRVFVNSTVARKKQKVIVLWLRSESGARCARAS